LDRIRLDILDAGRGLADPIRREILKAVEATGEGPVFRSAELAVPLALDAPDGASEITVAEGDGFASGQEICLVDRSRAECALVRTAAGPTLSLAAPLGAGFSAAATTVILIRRIFYPWPSGDGVLRRKVNGASAQPLMEEVAAFRCAYDEAANLARIGIRPAADPENEYAVTIFPKNAALARAGQKP
jgi:hypothetical protein